MADNEGKKLYEEAQRRLVASLLCGEESSVQALERVTEDDFEEPSLAVIFKSAADVLRAGENLSIISIAERLEADGELEHAGGVSELYSLKTQGEGYLDEAPIHVYARIVQQYSAKHKVNRTLSEYSQLFKADSGTLVADGVSALQADLNEVLYKLSDTETSSTSVDLADDFLGLLAERKRIAEENEESAEGLQGIPTPLPTLNEITTGWLKGQVITVAAQTAVGKSVFAVNSLTAACQAGKTVMFFSLEMERQEIETRIVSSTTGVPLKKLTQGDLSDEEMDRVKSGLDNIRDMNFVVDTESELTVDMIRARALKQAQSPDGLDMLIIDYLQLLTPSRRIANRQEAVAEISRSVKLLASSLGIPIIIVAQLTRPKKEQEDLTPTKYDIRESGAIANDSSIVLILHRPDTEDGSTPHTRVILDKNRNGEQGRVILCHSDLACSAFREIVRADDARMTDEDLEDLGEEFGDLESSSGDPDDLDFDFDNEETDF